MGSQNSRISSHDRAILNIKVQRDQLKHYRRKIDLVLQRETEIARNCIKAGDRRRAILALRQKKYQEALLLRTDDQLDMLNRLTTSIEFSLVEKDVYFGLKQGSQVLRSIHEELSIEKAEQILDNTTEAIQYQEDLRVALNSQMTNTDEEEALAEYDRLQFELAPEELPILPNVPKLPVFAVDAVSSQDVRSSQADSEPAAARAMEAT